MNAIRYAKETDQIVAPKASGSTVPAINDPKKRHIAPINQKSIALSLTIDKIGKLQYLSFFIFLIFYT